MVFNSPFVFMKLYSTIPIPLVLVSLRPTVSTDILSGSKDTKSFLSLVTDKLAPESQMTLKKLCVPTAFLNLFGAVKAAFKAIG